MAKKLSEADPREIERVARAVPGIAFAEMVARPDGGDVLNLVVWQDSDPEETAGRVEVALHDALGVGVAAGDVRLAGSADPPSGPSPELDVRVIELGGKTWATEPVGGDPLPPMPPAGVRRLTLLSVTVSAGPDRCRARVEVDAGEGTRVGDAAGAATATRQRRVVCEATAQAASAALGLPALDVEDLRVVDTAAPCALVVVSIPGAEDRRSAGAATIGADPNRAFALATIQAALAAAR